MRESKLQYCGIEATRRRDEGGSACFSPDHRLAAGEKRSTVCEREHTRGGYGLVPSPHKILLVSETLIYDDFQVVDPCSNKVGAI